MFNEFVFVNVMQTTKAVCTGILDFVKFEKDRLYYF